MPSFSNEFWHRFNQVAASIGARQAEDLITVIAAETAGTFDPRRTAYSRRPSTKPASWKDVISWESDHPGYSSGALGLNTIMRPAAQSLGFSAPDWWSIADLLPGDPKALDYTEKFFRFVRALRGMDRPFVDAVELYIANAAPGLLGNGKLSPDTIVYSGKAAAVNPALQGPDGYVRVKNMSKVLSQLASTEPGIGLSAKPFLNDYQSYVALTGDYYTGPILHQGEAPLFRPVSYVPDSTYNPVDPQGIDKINAANAEHPTNPNQVFARQILAAQDIPVGKDVLLPVFAVVSFVLVVKKFLL